MCKWSFCLRNFSEKLFKFNGSKKSQLRPSHPSLHRHRGTFEHKFENKFFDSLCSRVSRGKRKCFFGDKLCRGRSVHNAETCSKRDFRGNSPSSRSILVNFADEHVGKFIRRVWLRIGNVIAPFWTLGRRGELARSSPQRVSLETWFISHTFNAPRADRCSNDRKQLWDSSSLNFPWKVPFADHAGY